MFTCVTTFTSSQQALILCFKFDSTHIKVHLMGINNRVKPAMPSVGAALLSYLHAWHYFLLQQFNYDFSHSSIPSKQIS